MFISWRELTSCALVKKLKVDRAERHSARAVLRKCFLAWHNQYRVALKKQVSLKDVQTARHVFRLKKLGEYKICSPFSPSPPPPPLPPLCPLPPPLAAAEAVSMVPKHKITLNVLLQMESRGRPLNLVSYNSGNLSTYYTYYILLV